MTKKYNYDRCDAVDCNREAVGTVKIDDSEFNACEWHKQKAQKYNNVETFHAK